MIFTKSRLTRILSKVKPFKDPKLNLRQYMTPAHIASDLLWTAYMNGDIDGRIVFDLGAGTGMLTIGASLLGGRVTGFEIDSEAIKVAIENAQKLGVKILIFQTDIDEVEGFCHTVVMNPPFMVKGGKNDKVFLKKAFSLCDRIYSIHTSHTRDWIKSFADQNGFNSVIINTHDFPIPLMFKHHQKEKEYQSVDLWFFFK